MMFEAPESARLDSECSFLDIGSGFGKCVLHAKVRGKVRLSRGIEYIPLRHEKALETLHLLNAKFVPGLTNLNSHHHNNNNHSDENNNVDDSDSYVASLLKDLDLNGVELIRGDITDEKHLPLLYSASHIYMFDVVFSDTAMEQILPCIEATNFAMFACYHRPAYLEKLGCRQFVLIHKMAMRTTGGQSFTCYFYIKSGAMRKNTRSRQIEITKLKQIETEIKKEKMSQINAEKTTTKKRRKKTANVTVKKRKKKVIKQEEEEEQEEEENEDEEEEENNEDEEDSDEDDEETDEDEEDSKRSKKRRKTTNAINKKSSSQSKSKSAKSKPSIKEEPKRRGRPPSASLKTPTTTNNNNKTNNKISSTTSSRSKAKKTKKEEIPSEQEESEESEEEEEIKEKEKKEKSSSSSPIVKRPPEPIPEPVDYVRSSTRTLESTMALQASEAAVEGGLFLALALRLIDEYHEEKKLEKQKVKLEKIEIDKSQNLPNNVDDNENQSMEIDSNNNSNDNNADNTTINDNSSSDRVSQALKGQATKNLIKQKLREALAVRHHYIEECLPIAVQAAANWIETKKCPPKDGEEILHGIFGTERGDYRWVGFYGE